MISILNWLIEPLSYAFMQRGLAASLVVGIVCSVIGCYVVLRSMAFLGDAMAHAILPGVAVAYIFQGNLTVGAIVAALLVALGIGFLTKQGTLREDTAIGILFSATLALGIAIISSIRTYATDLSHILFGDVLGISAGDLVLSMVIGAVVLIFIVVLFKPFLVISFDPVMAATLRWPVALLQNLLLVLLSLTIVISIQTVGVGLAAAMLVTPGATAFMYARRLPAMMLLAALFGAISSLVGLYVSYYANIASGAGIVLTATFLFLIAFLFSPRKGLFRRNR